MKKFWVVILGLAFLTGSSLGLAQGKAKDSTAEGKTSTLEKVKQEVKEAVQAGKEYTQEQKEEYRKKIESKLKDYDRKWNALKAKAKKMGREGKAEVNQKIEVLREKKEAASRKSGELKKAGQQAWGDVKTGVDKAMDELEKAYQQARSDLK